MYLKKITFFIIFKNKNHICFPCIDSRSRNGLRHLQRQPSPLQRGERQSGAAFCALHRDSRTPRGVSEVSANDR